jgi:hypothetical protein
MSTRPSTDNAAGGSAASRRRRIALALPLLLVTAVLGAIVLGTR